MKIQVIIGSTREGRQSDRLAKWVATSAAELDGVEVETVDLRDYDMPLFNEAGSPQFNPNRKPVQPVKRWLDKLTEADAYILVTPEYNRSTSGVLKNALDYIDFQIQGKPVGLVAHGSTGGAQAVGHLRGIIPGLQSITVPKAAFYKDSIAEGIDDDGNLSAELKANPYGPQTALKGVLDDLLWYGNALTAARAQK